MSDALNFIKEIAPLVISLVSVIVAAVALLMNKRLACRQAVFSRQAAAAESFLSAFATAAGTSDSAAHRALLDAFCRCSLYVSPDTRTYMNHLVQEVVSLGGSPAAADLDKMTQELLIRLSFDLAQSWQGKVLPAGRTQRRVLRLIRRKSP